MALTIYGTPRSRTMRVLWLAEELGLQYEHRPLGWDDPFLKTDDFLRLNPAGAIPTIVDDGLPSRTIHLDMQPYRRVVAWLCACYDRQAARTTRTRFVA